MNFHWNVMLPAMTLMNSSDYRRIKRSISCLKDSKIQGLGSEFRIQDSEIWDPDLADPLRNGVAKLKRKDRNCPPNEVTVKLSF